MITHRISGSHNVNTIDNIDKKLLETEFLIANCRLIGEKWQWKTLVLAIFYPHLSIVKSVFDFQIYGVVKC